MVAAALADGEELVRHAEYLSGWASWWCWRCQDRRSGGWLPDHADALGLNDARGEPRNERPDPARPDPGLDTWRAASGRGRHVALGFDAAVFEQETFHLLLQVLGRASRPGSGGFH